MSRTHAHDPHWVRVLRNLKKPHTYRHRHQDLGKKHYSWKQELVYHANLLDKIDLAVAPACNDYMDAFTSTPSTTRLEVRFRCEDMPSEFVSLTPRPQAYEAIAPLFHEYCTIAGLRGINIVFNKHAKNVTFIIAGTKIHDIEVIRETLISLSAAVSYINKKVQHHRFYLDKRDVRIFLSRFCDVAKFSAFCTDPEHALVERKSYSYVRDSRDGKYATCEPDAYDDDDVYRGCRCDYCLTPRPHSDEYSKVNLQRLAREYNRG